MARALPRERPPHRLLPLAIGLAVLVALVVGVQPSALARALRHLDLRWYPVLAGLALAYYVLQGLRWHLVLRAAGVPTRPGRTVLLSLAGQSTALLPLGELGRAVFVAEATDTPVGVVAGTVTVQELTYSVLLLAVAVPATVGRPAEATAVLLALAGTVATFAVLLRRSWFERVMAVTVRVRALRAVEPAIRELQATVAVLLRQRAVYTSLWLAVLQVSVAVSLLWVAVLGLRPGSVSWIDVALVYTVVNLGSAISMVPGGLGAFELGGAGLLATAGVPFDVAAAAMLVHRGADKGLGTATGFACYAVARVRYGLGAQLLGQRSTAGHPAEGTVLEAV